MECHSWEESAASQDEDPGSAGAADRPNLDVVRVGESSREADGHSVVRLSTCDQGIVTSEPIAAPPSTPTTSETLLLVHSERDGIQVELQSLIGCSQNIACGQ